MRQPVEAEPSFLERTLKRVRDFYEQEIRKALIASFEKHRTLWLVLGVEAVLAVVAFVVFLFTPVVLYCSVQISAHTVAHVILFDQ